MKERQRVKQSETLLLTIKFFLPMAGTLILALLLVWGVVELKKPDTLPFQQVHITADDSHIPISVLKKVVSENLEGGFFSLNVDRLQEALRSLPWVSDVSLRRIWPNQLVIDVKEQHPVAQWGNQLINEHGQLFQPAENTIPSHLPLLQGPDDSQKEVFAKYLELNQTLSPLGLTLTALSLNDRHAWSLLLNGHIEVMLGKDDVDERMARFVLLFPRIVGAGEQEVDQVDLRYPNGLAIKWKQKP